MNIIPVSPVMTSKGALWSLVRILGETKAKPIRLAANDDPFTNFTAMGRAISTSLAAKLGLGSIFDGSFSANEQGWWFDNATFTDKYLETPAEPGSIQMTRWGVGLRIALRVYDLKASASINYGIVGAAVQLGLAKAQYEITGIGIGLPGLLIVLDNLPVTGELNAETYFKLTTTVAKQLKQYIEAHQDKLTAQPMAVGLIQDLETDKIALSHSVYYAVRGVADRRPLKETLEKAAPIFDREIIRYVYAKFGGNIPETDKPSRQAAQKADEWLSLP